MKTTFDFIDLIWKRLYEDFDLKTSITGSIYKHKRPDGSQKEDIVINGLPVNNDQLQTGVINVNFHCPNLVASINAQPVVHVPDNVKLNEVSKKIIALLKDYWHQEFHCDIQSQTVMEEPELRECFSNIRVTVFSINI